MFHASKTIAIQHELFDGVMCKRVHTLLNIRFRPCVGTFSKYLATSACRMLTRVRQPTTVNDQATVNKQPTLNNHATADPIATRKRRWALQTCTEYVNMSSGSSSASMSPE